GLALSRGLMLAATPGWIDQGERLNALARLLLDLGADPNLPAPDGRYALNLTEDREVAAALLVQGARPRTVGKEGEQPIHYWSGHGDPALVRLLLAKGADPVARDAKGLTPLDWAMSPVAEQGNPEDTLAALLHAGADPNKNAGEGLSLLGLAVLDG